MNVENTEVIETSNTETMIKNQRNKMENKKEIKKYGFGRWLPRSRVREEEEWCEREYSFCDTLPQKQGDFFTRLHLELPKEVVEKVKQLSKQLNDEMDISGRWYKEYPSFLTCMYENEFYENKVGKMVDCIVRFHIQKFVDMFQNPEYWECDEDIKPFIKKEICKSKTYFPDGEKYSKEGIWIDKETGKEKEHPTGYSSSHYLKIMDFRRKNYMGDTK